MSSKDLKKESFTDVILRYLRVVFGVEMVVPYHPPPLYSCEEGPSQGSYPVSRRGPNHLAGFLASLFSFLIVQR